jgi:hypothetical protein
MSVLQIPNTLGAQPPARLKPDRTRNILHLSERGVLKNRSGIPINSNLYIINIRPASLTLQGGEEHLHQAVSSFWLVDLCTQICLLYCTVRYGTVHYVAARD